MDDLRKSPDSKDLQHAQASLDGNRTGQGRARAPSRRPSVPPTGCPPPRRPPPTRSMTLRRQAACSPPQRLPLTRSLTRRLLPARSLAQRGASPLPATCRPVGGDPRAFVARDADPADRPSPLGCRALPFLGRWRAPHPSLLRFHRPGVDLGAASTKRSPPARAARRHVRHVALHQPPPPPPRFARRSEAQDCPGRGR